MNMIRTVTVSGSTKSRLSASSERQQTPIAFDLTVVTSWIAHMVSVANPLGRERRSAPSTGFAKKLLKFNTAHRAEHPTLLHPNPFPLPLALIGQQVKHLSRLVSARHPAFVGVSAVVIAEETAVQLFMHGRMFVQVKAPEQTVGRARRRGPKVKRKPLARAHAVRFAGRFNHVENNSAVKNEKKEKAKILRRGNGFTEVKTVGQAVTVEDQPRAGMELTYR